jgi:hypothetical protein
MTEDGGREANVAGVRMCSFTIGEKVCASTSSANQYKDVTMHIKTDHGDVQFPLTQLYSRETRLVPEMRSVGSTHRHRSPVAA